MHSLGCLLPWAVAKEKEELADFSCPPKTRTPTMTTTGIKNSKKLSSHGRVVFIRASRAGYKSRSMMDGKSLYFRTKSTTGNSQPPDSTVVVVLKVGVVNVTPRVAQIHHKKSRSFHVWQA